MASDIAVALIGGGTGLGIAVIGAVAEYLRRDKGGSDDGDEAVVTAMAKQMLHQQEDHERAIAALQQRYEDVLARAIQCEAREAARGPAT